MRFLLFFLAVTFSLPAHAAQKPGLVYFRGTEQGAVLKVKNPLAKPVQIRFQCFNAFSVQWLDIPAHKTKTIVLTAGEPIKHPCSVAWRVRP